MNYFCGTLARLRFDEKRNEMQESGAVAAKIFRESGTENHGVFFRRTTAEARQKHFHDEAAAVTGITANTATEVRGAFI